jgi:hypothetical protein
MVNRAHGIHPVTMTSSAELSTVAYNWCPPPPSYIISSLIAFINEISFDKLANDIIILK